MSETMEQPEIREETAAERDLREKHGLPAEVCSGPENWISVRLCRMGGDASFHYDGNHRVLVIELDSPKAWKHKSLLSALIRAAEYKMVAAGVLEQVSTSEQLEALAYSLFPMLGYSGLWKGLTKEDLDEYYVSNVTYPVERAEQIADIEKAREALREADEKGYVDWEDLKAELDRAASE